MDGSYTKDPFEGMERSEIRCSIDAMEEVKAELRAYVQTVADRKIDGFDIGEFSSYMEDCVIGDTVDTYIALANNRLEDMGPGNVRDRWGRSR